MRRLRLCLGLALALSGATVCAAGPSMLTPAKFELTGTLQQLDLGTRTATIDGKTYRLAPDAKVHADGYTQADTDGASLGDRPVGCRLGPGRYDRPEIQEMWVFPADYRFPQH